MLMPQCPSLSIHFGSLSNIKKNRVREVIIIKPITIRTLPKSLKLLKISGLAMKLSTATKSIAKLYISRLSTRHMVAFENETPSLRIK